MNRTGFWKAVAMLVIGISILAFNVQRAESSGSSAIRFTMPYGGPKRDEAYCVIQTTDGGYALAGYTNSYGAGGSDFWLVKTDPNGNELWPKTYGGPNDDEARSVIQTTDGGYALAGYTNSYGAGGSDFWLVKTDENGIRLWNKTYGGPNDDLASSVVQTSDGGYAIAGTTKSFGAGYANFWLVKTDAAGNALWNETYGGKATDYCFSMVKTSDGGYALAGFTGSFSVGYTDFWLVKTDAAGNALWNMTYGTPGYDLAYSVVQTSDGGYALAGTTDFSGAGGYDFWLVKTDASGNGLWNSTYGGRGFDEAWSVIQTLDGGYTLAGATGSYGAGFSDFWLVKIDANGGKLWDMTYGGKVNETAYSLIQTSDGGYALTGSTNSYGAGSADFWLVKTDENGVVPEFPPFSMLLLLVTLTFALVFAKKRLARRD